MGRNESGTGASPVGDTGISYDCDRVIVTAPNMN